jgi:nitrogenase subunit NifH
MKSESVVKTNPESNIAATENELKKRVCEMEAETVQQKSQLEEQSSVIKELEGTSSSAHQGT